MSESSTGYVMGHDDRERRRLSLQASILNPLSDQLLRRAGLSTGLRVLDIGCGIGERRDQGVMRPADSVFAW
jgi:cyclopropane fatty-acyl-phospholipid synthase-like methyltransferase